MEKCSRIAKLSLFTVIEQHFEVGISHKLVILAQIMFDVVV